MGRFASDDIVIRSRQVRTEPRFSTDEKGIGEEWRGLAGVTGLEPAASGVTGQRSNQLSYTP